jgi:tetratricopeptide (TPR) repeat protein
VRSHFFVALLAVFATPVWGADYAAFDPGRYSQAVTACDRLAAHPDDPNHVLPGLESAQMDLPKAIDACRKDLARDPDNPRLRYQLARALTYAGNVSEGLPLLERTVEQNYPQSLFVTGYLYLTGAYAAPTDRCRAGELIRASALAGRLAGQVGFPKYFLDGRFKGCPVKQDTAEMIGFLEAALKSKPDFYALLLAEELLRTLRALPPGVTH